MPREWIDEPIDIKINKENVYEVQKKNKDLTNLKLRK